MNNQHDELQLSVLESRIEGQEKQTRELKQMLCQVVTMVKQLTLAVEPHISNHIKEKENENNLNPMFR